MTNPHPLARRAFLGGLAASAAFAAGAASTAFAAGAAPSAPKKTGPYADGMSFLPEKPEDVRRSGVDLFIADVSKGEMDVDARGYKFYHRKFELCDRSITEAAARIRTEFKDVDLALSPGDIGNPGRIAAVFQFQGCEPIADDLSRMQYFRDKGLRILQLTHNESNAHATAYTDEKTGVGLSALGADGVREMNRIGLVPDVSHASEPTALETVALSKAPVILSHGACRALLNHPRGATDRMIKAVADSGGIFGVFVMSFWLTDDPVPLPAHYVAHIRHAVNVAGLDNVGVANDYPMEGLSADGHPFDNARDTVPSYGPWWEGNRARGIPGFGPTPTHAVIPEFNSIERLARIHQALLDGGFKPREADRIMGANWTRFFKENLR
ncbi:dipeptidase [Sandaracinobacter sp. RS1-74]|uniref:dipeptidase n=1 Tax=Sandaracinobacteroides sayramensis TaxID=2913411 RepID=UPI001EDC1836|nr:membrane dipeptidase [Sandaracinobacteroides sayramensis]MCG2840261.1 dipeptidase [Sandaracinobacteroides sayramensis]